MARAAATLLLAAVALALVASNAQAQSIGDMIGGIVGDIVDGVDSRTFFGGPGSRCQRRQPKEPRDLQAKPRSPTSVRLTWRARDNSCVDYYEVTWTAEGQPLPRTFSPRKVTNYLLDIDGLAPNTRYVFSVRAVNNANGASSVATTRATTPPQQRCNGPPRAPANVQTRSDSPTTLTVNWLVDANDRCIERYEVTYLAEGQSVAPRSLAPLYVQDKTVTLTGLQPDTVYSVVVAAVGTNGQRSTVTTRGRTQPLCSPLRAPVNLNARQSGPRSVQATWQNTQKSCVRATQVSFQDGNGNRGPIIQLGSAEESYTFANLQPGQQYTFSVRFVGRDGTNGPASTARVFLPNNSQGGTVTVPGRR